MYGARTRIPARYVLSPYAPPFDDAPNPSAAPGSQEPARQAGADIGAMPFSAVWGFLCGNLVCFQPFIRAPRLFFLNYSPRSARMLLPASNISWQSVTIIIIGSLNLENFSSIDGGESDPLHLEFNTGLPCYIHLCMALRLHLYGVPQVLPFPHEA